jgi:hypothetical protein
MSDKIIIFKDPTHPVDVATVIDLADKKSIQGDPQSTGVLAGRKIEKLDSSSIERNFFSDKVK